MTAVEWLEEELKANLKKVILEGDSELMESLFDQAKEMEKEQMLNAFQESRLTHPMIGFKHETFVDYYKETFK